MSPRRQLGRLARFYERNLGDPVWWSPTPETRFSGTVLRHDPRGYLVTLHDHPKWRWVEGVPVDQLTVRDRTPELETAISDSGVTVTTWNCPHPSHTAGSISAQSDDRRFALQNCARYMPPLGHRHDSVFPAEVLPEGVDPATVPVWRGGIAPASPTTAPGDQP